MFLVIAKKQPRLRVWRDTKIVAEFTPALRQTSIGDTYVGELRTDDEELVKYIVKSCKSSQISVKKISSSKLHTLE